MIVVSSIGSNPAELRDDLVLMTPNRWGNQLSYNNFRWFGSKETRTPDLPVVLRSML